MSVEARALGLVDRLVELWHVPSSAADVRAVMLVADALRSEADAAREEAARPDLDAPEQEP